MGKSLTFYTGQSVTPWLGTWKHCEDKNEENNEQEGAELCQAQPTDQRIFEPDEAMIWIGTWAKKGFGPNLRIKQLLLYWCCPVLPHP